MRVFLDTNVLVSALTTRGICADIVNVVVTEHQLVLGETVIRELRRVLAEKMSTPPDLMDEAEAFLRREGSVVSQGADHGFLLRDPDNVADLGEAIEALADVLVTGDRDFLSAAGELPVSALSPRGFWELLQKG